MENYNYFLGFVSLSEFLAMCFFAIMGIIISLLIDSTKRNPLSSKSPVDFSWWFLVKDNWKTILLTALIVLMTLRFATSFFPSQFETGDIATPIGLEKWMFGSLLIGLGYNQLIQVWKKKATFLQNKNA